MKKLLLAVFILISSGVSSIAQVAPAKSKIATAFAQFKPATITLTDGRVLRQSSSNIFLKNSRLIYKHLGKVMEANMSVIAKVDFGDRTYIKTDSALMYIVDSVKSHLLLCKSTIDMDSYKRNMINNQQITNLEISTMVSVTSTDLTNSEDLVYPLDNEYYYLIDGKQIKAHERTLSRVLPKEKRHLLKTIIYDPGFSWVDVTYLNKILALF